MPVPKASQVYGSVDRHTLPPPLSAIPPTCGVHSVNNTTLTTPVDLYASRVLDVQTSSFSGSIVRQGGQLCRYSSSGQLPLFNLPFFALRTVLLLRCRLRE